ncbi:MAG: bifunctional diaminohydroxyphosphoribosylaminopyrimidine deaminase/5-amino-6-(5-phosphoribosylamino)uracil reductase RibD [Acidobacteria bacterium]|nr:bifunctional diaminohydroxyphosphoribosylaminopyrimidine deaminase/5-amino-6-(5-phosphoribosylamino)uracil reductase RibD [Acidobacteriota bacterium]
MTTTDSTLLQEAFIEARRGVGRTSPNPAVGAVLARDGEIVGRGHHTWEGVKHAEVLAIEQAGERARGATLYLTLEPCSHQGRTAPCAEAVAAAGIRRVVVAMEDPNPLVRGRGLAKLRDAGIETQVETACTAEALALNQPFVHFMNTGRPLVTIKAALTLDGKIAAPIDNTGWITSEKARAHVQELRYHTDAILTGIGTVLADDCLLTDRTARPRSRPLLRIVLDSQLRIPLTSRMVESAQSDVMVVATSLASAERRRALEDLGIRVLVADGPAGRTDVGQVVQALAAERYLSLMIEGGSKVNWAALESNAADKIFFYYAPKILGGLESLPVAGGAGKPRRADAIRFRDVTLHVITPEEFAVEAWLIKP